MSQSPASMAMMKDPAKRLGEVIGIVDDAREVNQENVTIVLPILDGKVLDGNVAGPLCWDAGVHHINGRLVVVV